MMTGSLYFLNFKMHANKIRELTYINSYVKRKKYSFHTFTFLANKSILEERLFLPFIMMQLIYLIPELQSSVYTFSDLRICVHVYLNACDYFFFSFLVLLFLFSSIYQTCVIHSSPSGN